MICTYFNIKMIAAIMIHATKSIMNIDPYNRILSTVDGEEEVSSSVGGVSVDRSMRIE